MTISQLVSRAYWLSETNPKVVITLEAIAAFGPSMVDDSVSIRMPEQIENWCGRYWHASGEHLWDLLWNYGLKSGVNEALANAQYPVMSGPSLFLELHLRKVDVDLDSLSKNEIGRLSRKLALLAQDVVDDLLSEAIEQGLFVAYAPRECAIEPEHLDDSTALERILKLDPEQLSFEQYVRQIRAIVAETGVTALDAQDHPSADDTMPAP